MSQKLIIGENMASFRLALSRVILLQQKPSRAWHSLAPPYSFLILFLGLSNYCTEYLAISKECQEAEKFRSQVVKPPFLVSCSGLSIIVSIYIHISEYQAFPEPNIKMSQYQQILTHTLFVYCIKSLEILFIRTF